MYDGELGSRPGIESRDGVDLVVEIEDSPPSGFQLGDLPQSACSSDWPRC